MWQGFSQGPRAYIPKNNEESPIGTSAQQKNKLPITNRQRAMKQRVHQIGRLATMAILLLMITLPTTLRAQQGKGLEERLRDHLYLLASDSLHGREAGTEDAMRAAEYIADQFASIGLKPYEGESYFQYFTVPLHSDRTYRNVIGIIEGSDPALSDRYIVVGAHYDHLGEQLGKIYPGADDNASGSSALIEVARNLMLNPQRLGRSVIIVAFDAEEMGLYGSNYLASVMPAERIDLMISMDMVGWLRQSGKLHIEGTGTVVDGEKWVNSVGNRGIDLHLKPFENSVMTATDTRGFARKQVPTFAVTTGTESPYHKPGDTADKIDYQGLTEITHFMTSLVATAASEPSFRSSGRVASIHRKLPPVEINVGVMAGSTRLKFPDSAFEGRSAFSYGANLSLLLHTGNTMWHTGVSYERSSARWPSMTAPLRSQERLHLEQLTVPLTANIRLGEPDDPIFMYIGVGGYYTHRLDGYTTDKLLTLGPEGIADNEWGTQWELGMRLSSWDINVTWRNGHTNLIEGSDAPKIKTRQKWLTIAYIF